jgi:hypothetical protein
MALDYITFKKNFFHGLFNSAFQYQGHTASDGGIDDQLKKKL